MVAETASGRPAPAAPLRAGQALHFLSALPAEARTLGGALRGSVSGVGPLRATQAAEAAVEAGASGLVSWGVCGALDRGLAPGELLLADWVLDEAGVRHPATLPTRLRAALLTLGGVHAGGLACAAQPVLGPARASLARATNARAVDMESGCIAAVAERHGLPFFAVRAVVDGPDAEVPAWMTAILGPDGRASLHRVAKGLLACGDLGGLLRVARAHWSALAALQRAAPVVRRVLSGAPA